MSRAATAVARKSNANAGVGGGITGGFPASLNSLVIREKGGGNGNNGGGNGGDSGSGMGSTTSHRRVRLVDGVGRGGRTAPEPPPSSRQTSLEANNISFILKIF